MHQTFIHTIHLFLRKTVLWKKIFTCFCHILSWFDSRMIFPYLEEILSSNPDDPQPGFIIIVNVMYFLTTLHGMKDLSSLTWHGTCPCCSGSAGSLES